VKKVLPVSYCVITADVNKSREISDRQEVQERLLDCLRQANREFAESLAVNFAVTLGDEWQGLLRGVTKSYSIASYFQETLHPIAISVGIGVGEISTGLAVRSTEMDGEAFHRSREALTFCKQHNRELYFVTERPGGDALLNTTLHLLQVLKDSWTQRQYQKIMLYKRFRKEKLVAEELGISQADVNKTLSSANGRVFLESQEQICEFFAQGMEILS